MPTPRELIRSQYDAFARGDAGSVLAALDEEVVWNEAEGGPLAVDKPYVGPEEFANGVLGRLAGEIDELRRHPGYESARTLLFAVAASPLVFAAVGWLFLRGAEPAGPPGRPPGSGSRRSGHSGGA